MTDDTKTIYTATPASLNQYMSAIGWASVEEWLPYSEIDVGERVYVELDDCEFDLDDNTVPLEDFIAELRAVAAKAPKRAEVVIEIGTGGYHDDPHATYEIGYWREPTKKERAEREETNRKIRERGQRRAEEAEAKEREDFERLKAKFGSDA